MIVLDRNMELNCFTREETLLFELIAESLNQVMHKDRCVIEADFEKVLSLAGHQAVLPMIYPALKTLPLTTEQLAAANAACKYTALEYYQIFFLARDIIRLLEEQGISVVLLKGVTAARFYPVAETRKSSDVDILLPECDQLKKASQILEKAGYRRMDGQIANHHQVWGTPDNHVLELHTMIVEPFDQRGLNAYIKSLYTLHPENISRIQVMGTKIPALPEGLLAFHLLLHMLQDFLRMGFGLKLLCDWVVFWNHKVESKEVEAFLQYVADCRLGSFLNTITTVCVQYLGLRTDGSGSFSREGDVLLYKCGQQPTVFCRMVSQELCENFLQETLEAERYGKTQSDRTAVLRGTHLGDYIREFHHQTVLGFPRASRMVITLPVLYIIVFIRFIYNNHTVRGQSLKAVLKKAKQRTRLVESMKLFKE